MSELEIPDEVRAETSAAWKRYLDHLIPFRPDLHRYCRGLTGNVWDAEDLVQDTVIRGFGTLSSMHRTIGNPRGYLVRIATNLWIDTQRRRASEATALSGTEPGAGAAPRPTARAEVRAAGAELLQRLSPQERAALLMKDVFDMSLEETSEALGTSVGAVKAALHRGRGRLSASEELPEPSRARPSVALVDRFVELLNGSDLHGLLDLMQDHATVQELGTVLDVGRAQFEREGSFMWQSVHVHPELPPDVRPPKWRNERAMYEGEPIMISFGPTPDGEKLMGITRLEEEKGKVLRLRAYIFTPEVVRVVGKALGYPVLTGLYRFPF